MIDDGDIALGRAYKRSLAGPAGSLFERFQDHAKLVAVINKRVGGQGEDFGNPGPGGPYQVQNKPVGGVFFGVEQQQDFEFQQIGRHGVDGIEHPGAFGHPTIPFDHGRS